LVLWNVQILGVYGFYRDDKKVVGVFVRFQCATSATTRKVDDHNILWFRIFKSNTAKKSMPRIWLELSLPF
jgi:hypothetical protein